MKHRPIPVKTRVSAMFGQRSLEPLIEGWVEGRCLLLNHYMSLWHSLRLDYHAATICHFDLFLGIIVAIALYQF